MKIKYQLKFFFLFLVITFSCKINSQKCGYIKLNENRIMEFNLCDSFLEQDTVKAEIVQSGMGPTWGELDGVKFILPNGYKIVNAKLSTEITPSIWPNTNENVIQYMLFTDYRILCKNAKNVEIKGGIVMRPMELNEQQISDLYFNNAPELRKEQLVNYLVNKFEQEKILWKEQKPDSLFSAKDIKDALYENERTKKVYLKYFNNFTTMKNAPRENFDLDVTAKYLTLSIENNNNIKDVTLEYFPVIGN